MSPLLAQLQIPNQPGAPAEQPDIRDIVPPAPLPDYLQLALTIVLASLALCLIACVVILILRFLEKRRLAAAIPPTPSEVAHAALERLYNDAANLTPNQFGLETSNIIKQYFHDRYDDPLLYETSEEFAVRENHEKSIPHSKRVALGEFFAHCDLIKYANTPNAADQATPILEQAIVLIEESAIPEATIAETQFVMSSKSD